MQLVYEQDVGEHYDSRGNYQIHRAVQSALAVNYHNKCRCAVAVYGIFEVWLHLEDGLEVFADPFAGVD